MDKIIIDYVKKNVLILIIMAIMTIFLALKFGQFFWQFTGTLAMAVMAEMVALLLSNFAVYVYTHISFTKGISYGDDGQLDDIERTALSTVVGDIFKGVHFLVGLALIGVYIVTFG